LLLQTVADEQQPPPCTTETPQEHLTLEHTKEVELSERKLTWHEQLQQQQHHSVSPLPEASLPVNKQQQQQQQQLPDCWDELDVDSISLLAPTATTSMAPPSSPGAASAASSRGSFSMLGADREVWLVSGSAGSGWAVLHVVHGWLSSWHVKVVHACWNITGWREAGVKQHFCSKCLCNAWRRVVLVWCSLLRDAFAFQRWCLITAAVAAGMWCRTPGTNPVACHVHALAAAPAAEPVQTQQQPPARCRQDSRIQVAWAPTAGQVLQLQHQRAPGTVPRTEVVRLAPLLPALLLLGP
jgi:hypothetical protein